MHEYGITESIVKISCEEAINHGASKINEIRLKIGELSGLIPESIQNYFDIISDGTMAHGAKLIVEKVPIQFKCNKCQSKSFVEKGSYLCPNCNSNEISIIGGHEYLIDSMEVE